MQQTGGSARFAIAGNIDESSRPSDTCAQCIYRKLPWLAASLQLITFLFDRKLHMHAALGNEVIIMWDHCRSHLEPAFEWSFPFSCSKHHCRRALTQGTIVQAQSRISQSG